MNEEQVAFALCKQVVKAAKGAPNFRHVTTIITRAMWQVYLRGTGHPETDEPNEEVAFSKRRSVDGSKTIVLDVPGMWAVSRLTL